MAKLHIERWLRVLEVGTVVALIPHLRGLKSRKGSSTCFVSISDGYVKSEAKSRLWSG